MVKEIFEGKSEDLRKLSNKAIKKTKSNDKEKMDNLKAQPFTEYMNTDQRRIWSPKLGKLRVNE